ncbi:hypothetical protein KKF70_03305 [bacterium]|nr:hypothetical protein [bacterium]MBU3930655.1 hypothetical protein [bacterium]MBU4123446.1 hypothetical protein [bacterium]
MGTGIDLERMGTVLFKIEIADMGIRERFLPSAGMIRRGGKMTGVPPAAATDV